MAAELLVGSSTVWFLASALIVAWLTTVSWVMKPISASVHATPSLAKMEATVSNAALKGDRLNSTYTLASRDRWGATRADAGKPGKAPIGCETAFSKLVVGTTHSVRCLT